jgi:sugar fermentation stimulation protein A
VGQLLEARALSQFAGLKRWIAERGIGDGRRIDFVLETTKGKKRSWVFLEVKNCHLVYPDHWAYFPDCVSERASHHLEALRRLAGLTPEELAALDPFRDGKAVQPPDQVRAAVLFVVQIPRVRGVRPSEAHDRVFAETARQVAGAGVEFFAVGVDQDGEEVRIGPQLPVDLDAYPLDPIVGWIREAKRKKAESNA